MRGAKARDFATDSPKFGVRSTRVPRLHPVDGGCKCCERDEGRPLGNGVQTRFSNYLELLSLRAMVVSVKEKRVRTWSDLSVRVRTNPTSMCLGDERK